MHLVGSSASARIGAPNSGRVLHKPGIRDASSTSVSEVLWHHMACMHTGDAGMCAYIFMTMQQRGMPLYSRIELHFIKSSHGGRWQYRAVPAVPAVPSHCCRYAGAPSTINCKVPPACSETAWLRRTHTHVCTHARFDILGMHMVGKHAALTVQHQARVRQTTQEVAHSRLG